jgi:hypothetical protein
MRKPDAESLYVSRVLALYLSLPSTPTRTSRRDRQLAQQWYAQPLAWELLEAALLLAAARRSLRDPALPPLGPIRSLHYFLPILTEVTAAPLAPEYVQYLRSKLATLTPTAPTNA